MRFRKTNTLCKQGQNTKASYYQVGGFFQVLRNCRDYFKSYFDVPVGLQSYAAIHHENVVKQF